VTSATSQERGTTSSRYAILGRLAGGGMADIYLAHATTEAGVSRYLVLKRVLAERSRDPAFAKMFLDEARLAAQLQHPNIAQVYDVGILGGSYFFTMEYVHGEDVRAILQRLSSRKQQLPVNLALHIASCALQALHHAHERTAADGTPLEVVHRDVTPSNVMVGYEGVVKLLDFGVAKANQRSTESRSGAIKGKIAYLSPEQCRGIVVDRRSDIFSLGIVLFEMLTCKRLFKRDSDFDAMLAITSEQVPPPSRARPGLSPAIDRIVLTALDKDRDHRYASAAAMLDDLESVATAERHLMSSAALGKFMRELFGSKPEPWIELRSREDGEHPITITSESLGEYTEPLAANQRGTVIDWRALQLQLDRAPELKRDPVPQSDDMEAMKLGRASAGSLAALRPRRRPLAIALPMIAILVGGAAAAWYLFGGEIAPAASHDDAAIIATRPVIPAAPVDATITQSAIDAPIVRTPTIADAVTRADWAQVLRLCGAVGPHDLTSDERRNCGVAACNSGQRATALGYDRSVSGGDQAAIERACREHGVSLAVRPSKATVKAPTDPCKDPAYLEANPFKCQ
jgi:serine/threonine protein kinase